MRNNKMKIFLLHNIYMLKNHSIKRNMIVFVALIVLIPMVTTGIYFYYVVSSILTTQVLNKLNDFTNQTNNLIYSQFESTTNLYFNLINSREITKNLSLFKKTNEDPVNKFLVKDNIVKDIHHLLFFNNAWKSNLINSIFIATDNEDNYLYLIRNSLELKNKDTYTDLMRKPRSGNDRFEIVPPSPKFPIIHYVRNFFNENDATLEGTIILDINESVISDSYERIIQYKDSQGVVFNNEGIIISDTDKSLLGKKVSEIFLKQKQSDTVKRKKIGNEMFWIASKKIEGYDLTSLIAVPERSVFFELTKSILNYLFIIAGLMIIFVFVGILFSSKVIRHIKVLIENMEKVQQGNYSTRMGGYKEIELNRLSNIFNKMINRIDYLFNEVYKNQLLVKEAELKSLQAQINPHFLFNVLICIGWKAKMSENETIYKMVSSLSELLQASIYVDLNQKTTINDEIKNVEFYLYLQQERFGDKITIHMSIDAAINHFYLPKLCIQPVVENAIVHGLENKIGKGNLFITAYEKSELIYIEIIDDGVGFDTKGMDLTGENVVSQNNNKKNHHQVGLVNANKRIKFMYGEQYGITVKSELSKGTSVVICMPVDKGGSPNVSDHDS